MMKCPFTSGISSERPQPINSTAPHKTWLRTWLAEQLGIRISRISRSKRTATTAGAPHRRVTRPVAKNNDAVAHGHKQSKRIRFPTRFLFHPSWLVVRNSREERCGSIVKKCGQYPVSDCVKCFFLSKRKRTAFLACHDLFKYLSSLDSAGKWKEKHGSFLVFSLRFQVDPGLGWDVFFCQFYLLILFLFRVVVSRGVYGFLSLLVRSFYNVFYCPFFVMCFFVCNL